MKSAKQLIEERAGIVQEVSDADLKKLTAISNKIFGNYANLAVDVRKYFDLASKLGNKQAKAHHKEVTTALATISRAMTSLTPSKV